MRISDWSSDVCSSDLVAAPVSGVCVAAGAWLGPAAAAAASIWAAVMAMSAFFSVRARLLAGIRTSLFVVLSTPLVGWPEASVSTLFSVPPAAPWVSTPGVPARSEARRVGQEGGRKGRSRWGPDHEKTKQY